MEIIEIEDGESVGLDISGGETSNVRGEPYIGQEFMSLDDVYEFYNAFALSTGFSIRKGHQYTSRNSKELIKKTYVCSREGKKEVRNGSEGPQLRPRPIVRDGCMAKLDVSLNKEVRMWVVKCFVNEHSHPLINTPSKKTQLRSHRRVHRTSECVDMVNTLHASGLRAHQIPEVLNNMNKDINLEITPQECRSILGRQRRNNMGKESVKVIKYFESKQAVDPEFFFAIEIDNEQTLRSVFWADGRARSTYYHFGDTVSFDVTYRTNAFQLPFAPFTGINHHLQSTLFGCALLADESEETFVWLFEQWLRCMWHKAPVSIITDQDPAMYNAIKRVFPQTRHRFCSWHLNKHESEKLKLLHPSRAAFSIDYRLWLSCKTIPESEEGWKQLKEKYPDIVSGWLENLYEKQRHHWVKAYLRDTFFGGMKSSQRSESINAFFKGFVNAKTPLYEFVEQYENAVRCRRNDEKKADYDSMVSKPILNTPHPFEKQGAELYTRKVFEIFQKELFNGFACAHEKLRVEGGVITYKVWPHTDKTGRWNEVTYYDGSMRVKCSCGKFEFKGILCAHCLHIMVKKQVPFIPEHYILFRYTMGARYTSQVEEKLSCNGVTSMMGWCLRAKARKLVNASLGDLDRFKIVDTALERLCKEIEVEVDDDMQMNDKESEIGCATNLSELIGSTPEITIHDPQIAKHKGRPRNLERITSGVEKSKKESMKRKCGVCGERGHYATTCKKKGAAENGTQSTDKGTMDEEAFSCAMVLRL